MFVKFTRLDGSPLWINSCFVVTVEPRRGGGSVVVPIGDGLDYDVRESPETVLGLLAAPVAAVEPAPVQVQAAEALSVPSVVPVPPPAALPGKFEDVVSSGLSAPTPDEIDATPVESPAEPSAKPTRAKRKPKAESAEDGAKPKKATRTRKTAAKKAEPPMDEDQVERLKRMSPGSLKKLQNTLASQFRLTNVDDVVNYLIDAKILTLDQDHVSWST